MRRVSTVLLAAIVLTAALAAPEGAGALGLEVEGRVWAPSFSGSGDLPDLGLDPEIDLDFGDLLELDAKEVFEIRGTFRIALGFYLRGTYQKLNNSGSRDINLGDLDLPIPLPPLDLSANVRSALDFEYGRVALGWRFVAPEQLFSVGAFVEAKGVRGSASIAVDSIFISDGVVEEFEGGAASWGLTADFKPGEKWKLFAEASTVFGDEEVDMTDIEIGGRFYPTKIFGIGAGYRSMDLQGVIDEVPIDGSWKGVFLTAIVEF